MRGDGYRETMTPAMETIKRILGGVSNVRGDQAWARRLPATIAVTYAVLAVAWCLIEHELIGGPELPKELAFTLAISVLLYWIAGRGVSAIRASESALRESEERLARILETDASGIIVVDRDGEVTFANKEAAAVLGLAREDLIGRNYMRDPGEVVTADGKPFPAEDLPFDRVMRTGQPVYGLEMGVRRRDGKTVILSANAAPFQDPDGRIVGMVWSFSDITERKQETDLALLKLSLAVEQSSTGIAITDRAGRIEYVNPRFTALTGYAPGELLGAKMPCPTEVSPDACRRICGAIAAGVEWRGEFRNRRKNGEPCWESAALSPIRNAQGEITNYLCMREDITEQRLAHEALRESRARFRNLVESISDWVWEVDRNGVYTYVSPKVRDLLGYEAEEVLGKTPFDLMPSYEARRVSKIFQAALERRAPFRDLENVNRHRDGRLVVLETSGVPFFGSDGSFLGYRGVDRDVSERKRVEEKLRESEERFRQLFEQNEEPLILFKPGTAAIIDVNPAAVELYGYERSSLIENGPSLFVDPAAFPEFERKLESVGPRGGLAIDRATHVRKDGTAVIVSIRAQSVRLHEGYVSYCSIRDITERIRMEEEAKVHQAQLIHANRMTSLGMIVSGVAHEINNPNNLVMFNAPMIAAAWRDAEPVLSRSFRADGDFIMGGLPYSEMRGIIPKLLEGIRDAACRIKSIVGNLKDYAGRDRSRRDLPVSVNEVVVNALAIIRHEVMRGTHLFSLDLADGLPPVAGSPQQLEQVLMNLVINALHALPDNRRGIRVSTSPGKASGTVEIRVEDEGTGIPPDVMAHITEPFHTTKLDNGGLGLGLSISSSIVKEHGGTMEFETEVGKGTRVRVILPAAGAEGGGREAVLPPEREALPATASKQPADRRRAHGRTSWTAAER